MISRHAFTSAARRIRPRPRGWRHTTVISAAQWPRIFSRRASWVGSGSDLAWRGLANDAVTLREAASDVHRSSSFQHSFGGGENHHPARWTTGGFSDEFSNVNPDSN